MTTKEKLYIIKDTRDGGYWRADSKGYCNNLALAGLYSEKEAFDIHANRTTDKPILVTDIVPELQRQSLDSDLKLRMVQQALGRTSDRVLS